MWALRFGLCPRLSFLVGSTSPWYVRCPHGNHKTCSLGGRLGFMGLGGLYPGLALRIAKIWDLLTLSFVKSLSSRGLGGHGRYLGGDIRDARVLSEVGKGLSSCLPWVGDLWVEALSLLWPQSDRWYSHWEERSDDQFVFDFGDLEE